MAGSAKGRPESRGGGSSPPASGANCLPLTAVVWSSQQPPHHTRRWYGPRAALPSAGLRYCSAPRAAAPLPPHRGAVVRSVPRAPRSGAVVWPSGTAILCGP